MAENKPYWKEIFERPGNTLTCGQPQREHLEILESLEENPKLLKGSISNESMALCCVGALWLKADYFDRSHRIFQEIQDTTGSLWHGISHRREGDFANAGYWFSRSGLHPSGIFLARKLKESSIQGFPHGLIREGSWNFKVFTQVVEGENAQDPPNPMVLRLQDMEWKNLFLWTLDQATI